MGQRSPDRESLQVTDRDDLVGWHANTRSSYRRGRRSRWLYVEAAVVFAAIALGYVGWFVG